MLPPKSDPAKLEGARLVKLKRLLLHARQNVAYYRELYENCDLELKQLSDIRKIPINNLARFKQQSSNAITTQLSPFDSLLKYSTSGSSGVPFIFYLSAEELQQRQMKTMRFLWFNGWRPWWRGAYLVNVVTPPPSWLDRIIMLRKKTISSQQDIRQQAEQLIAFKPQLLYGIPSTLERVAEWMINHKRSLSSIRLILGEGETINYDCRERFKKAFGHPGMSSYGSRECGIIGWSCPFCNQFHFDDDGIIAEIVAPEFATCGKNEIGRLLITVLDQYTTPIIRYDIGDLVRIQVAVPCSKIRFSQCSEIIGRAGDLLSDRQGRQFHVNDIHQQLLPLKEVLRIQFVELDTTGRILIRYIALRDDNAAELEIRKKMAKIIDAEISLCASHELSLEEGGKYPLLIKKTVAVQRN